jgi:tripartite-type tricarboxylate transporter receptor subunit TctC
LPGFEASAWYGIGAPKNTPAEIIERLNREVGASIADSNFAARLANLRAAVLAGSPGDFGKLISDETRKWATSFWRPTSRHRKARYPIAISLNRRKVSM